MIFVLLTLVFGANGARFSKDSPSGRMTSRDPSRDPSPTHSGYLPVDGSGSELYYSYWEADSVKSSSLTGADGGAPIILWLQGGPGCASTFGGFYEVGPYLINEELELKDNPGEAPMSFIFISACLSHETADLPHVLINFTLQDPGPEATHCSCSTSPLELAFQDSPATKASPRMSSEWRFICTMLSRRFSLDTLTWRQGRCSSLERCG